LADSADDRVCRWQTLPMADSANGRLSRWPTQPTEGTTLPRRGVLNPVVREPPAMNLPTPPVVEEPPALTEQSPPLTTDDTDPASATDTDLLTTQQLQDRIARLWREQAQIQASIAYLEQRRPSRPRASRAARRTLRDLHPVVREPPVTAIPTHPVVETTPALTLPIPWDRDCDTPPPSAAPQGPLRLCGGYDEDSADGRLCRWPTLPRADSADSRLCRWSTLPTAGSQRPASGG
jgi:hypothetical protein